MSDETVHCSFLDADPSEANMLAENLSDFLKDEMRDVQIERERDDPNSQDFGATLVIVLGTPAAVALAKGLSKWLAKRSDAKLHLVRKDKKGNHREVTVHGQIGERADALIRDFFTDDKS